MCCKVLLGVHSALDDLRGSLTLLCDKNSRRASRWKNSDRMAKRNRVAHKHVNASAAESSSPTHQDHAAKADSGHFVVDPALFKQLLPKRGRPAGARDNRPRRKRLLASESSYESTDAPAKSLQASPEPDAPAPLNARTASLVSVEVEVDSATGLARVGPGEPLLQATPCLRACPDKAVIGSGRCSFSSCASTLPAP